MTSLDEIINLLDHHGQRATYGAVAQLLGESPRSLLKGREREPRASWIVNRQTGLPTGYQNDQLDPRLTDSAPVLESADELRTWLTSVSAIAVLS